MRLIDADALWEELGILYHQNNGKVTWNDALMEIKTTPTIEPERKKGKWNMIQGNIVVCSECGIGAPQVMTGCLMNRHLEPNRTNFCPNCGADMKSETEPYNVNVEGKA